MIALFLSLLALAAANDECALSSRVPIPRGVESVWQLSDAEILAGNKIILVTGSKLREVYTPNSDERLLSILSLGSSDYLLIFSTSEGYSTLLLNTAGRTSPTRKSASLAKEIGSKKISGPLVDVYALGDKVMFLTAFTYAVVARDTIKDGNINFDWKVLPLTTDGNARRAVGLWSPHKGNGNYLYLFTNFHKKNEPPVLSIEYEISTGIWSHVDHLPSHYFAAISGSDSTRLVKEQQAYEVGQQEMRTLITGRRFFAAEEQRTIESYTHVAFILGDGRDVYGVFGQGLGRFGQDSKEKCVLRQRIEGLSVYNQGARATKPSLALILQNNELVRLVW